MQQSSCPTGLITQHNPVTQNCTLAEADDSIPQSTELHLLTNELLTVTYMNGQDRQINVVQQLVVVFHGLTG